MTTQRIFVALGSAGLLASGLLATGATAASAASLQPVFSVSTHRVAATSSFTTGATNVGNQCLIRYQVRSANGDVLFVAKRKVTTGASSIKLTAPSAAGQFFVGVNVYGKDCNPAAKASTLIAMRAT